MTNSLYYDKTLENAPKNIELAAGSVYGYHFVIRSYGTHPCAYIEVPAGHQYFGKGYDDAYIPCHGGLTYADDLYKDGSWWFGWDYAHCDDFYYCPSMPNSLFNGHIYTLDEIFADVQTAIAFLVKKDEEAKEEAERIADKENKVKEYVSKLPKALRDLIDETKRHDKERYSILLDGLSREV